MLKDDSDARTRGPNGVRSEHIKWKGESWILTCLKY